MTTRGVTGAGHRQTLGVGASLPLSRAAAELTLKPREFELAVQLGLVRTVALPSGRRRVPRAELERLGGADGFPESLRERLRVVGTAEGAALLGISPARFTRLARAGCFAPVRFSVNRYRAVVWQYLAADLVEYGDREPALLRGALPPGLRAMLQGGADRRARGWRGLRVRQALAQRREPWERAAVFAAVLSPIALAEEVPDAVERDRLRRLGPDLVPVRGGSEAARAVAEGLLIADCPDEELWLRLSLAVELDDARRARPVPPPDAGEGGERVPGGRGAAGGGAGRGRGGGLLGWWRGRGR